MSGPGAFTPGQVRLGDRVLWQGVANQVVAFRGSAVVLLTEEASTSVEVLYAAMVSTPDFSVLDGDGSPVASTPMPVVDAPPPKAERKKAKR